MDHGTMEKGKLLLQTTYISFNGFAILSYKKIQKNMLFLTRMIFYACLLLGPAEDFHSRYIM